MVLIVAHGEVETGAFAAETHSASLRSSEGVVKLGIALREDDACLAQG